MKNKYCEYGNVVAVAYASPHWYDSSNRAIKVFQQRGFEVVPIVPFDSSLENVNTIRTYKRLMEFSRTIGIVSLHSFSALRELGGFDAMKGVGTELVIIHPSIGINASDLAKRNGIELRIEDPFLVLGGRIEDIEDGSV